MGAQFGDLKGLFNYQSSLLKSIDRSLRCLSCGGDAAITTAGANSNVPEGMKSLALVKTSDDSDTVTITLSDSSTFQLTQQGEVFVDAASPGGVLPAYTVVGPGTWKWHGIK